MSAVLHGITWANPRGYDPLVAAAAEWERRTEVEVVWEQRPWYAFEQAVLDSLANGGPFDLVMLDHPWTGTLASSGGLRPWDALLDGDAIEELRRRTVPPSLESYELDGHLWALPVDAACQCAVLRPDLVDEATLPATWAELEVWAEARHDPPRTYGLVLCLEGVQGSCLLLSLLAALGCEWLGASAGGSFDRAAAAEALSEVDALLRFTPPGSTRWGPWDVYERLLGAGDVGYCPALFGYVNYFGSVPALAVAPMPRLHPDRPSRPLLGGVGLGLAAASGQQAEAAAHGRFLMEDTTQREIVAAHSGQPGVRAAWTDPTLDERHGCFYTGLAQNMAKAYVRPRFPGFHDLELRIGATLQRLWDREATLAATLAALDALATTYREVA